MILRLFTRAVAALLLGLAASMAMAAVDANKASQADLETVKGIGPALSGKILAERKKGDFKDWGDFVERVGGVGPGNAAKFSSAGLTINGAAYGGASAADKKTAKADKPEKAEKTEKKK